MLCFIGSVPAERLQIMQKGKKEKKSAIVVLITCFIGRLNFFEKRLAAFQEEIISSVTDDDMQICMYDNWNKYFKVSLVIATIVYCSIILSFSV